MDIEKEMQKVKQKFEEPVTDNADPVRVNIRISKKVKNYFEKLSKETAVAQSSLMAMALSEYVDQKFSIYAMGELKPFMDDLQLEMEKQNNEK